MAGKDGAKWGHNWVPLNAAAAAVKARRAPAAGTVKPMQRQPRLSDVKPTAGSFLPLAESLGGKPSAPKTTAAKTAAAKSALPKTAVVRPAAPQPAQKKTTEERVHAAVKYAAANSKHVLYNGDTVPISDVRDEMARAGVTGEAFDNALMNLQQQRKVTLYSSSADRMLTDKQKTGGLRQGGRDVNIVTFG